MARHDKTNKQLIEELAELHTVIDGLRADVHAARNKNFEHLKTIEDLKKNQKEPGKRFEIKIHGIVGESPTRIDIAGLGHHEALTIIDHVIIDLREKIRTI